MMIISACITALGLMAGPAPDVDAKVSEALDALRAGLSDVVVKDLRDNNFLDKDGQTGSLARQIRMALEMDELLASLAAHRAGKAAGGNDDIKTRQFNRLENLKNALVEADQAASEAAKKANRAATEAEKKKAWWRWIALTRACLRLADSVPSVAALVPIAEQECRMAVVLDEKALEYLRKRYDESLALRSDLTAALGAPGADVSEARLAASTYASSLIKWAESSNVQWKKKTDSNDTAPSQFVTRWRDWMRAEGKTDSPPRSHRLAPVWTRLEAFPAQEDPKALGFLLRDVRLLVPWPFFLAEHLGLGEIWLRYEAPAFEWTEGSTPAAPEIVPRIRVVAEFRVRPGARPRALGDGPIVACDRRLRGVRPSMILFKPPPPAAPAVPNPDAPVEAPAFPAELADLVKEKSPDVPKEAPDWFHALNSGFRGRRAIDALVEHYWRQGNRLNEDWETAVMPAEFPLNSFDRLAELGVPPEVAARPFYTFDDSTTDLPAIVAVIQWAARDAIDGLAVEGVSAKLTAQADQARKAFAKAGADPLAVHLPAELMVEHAARLASSNRSAVATMLPVPLPLAGAVVHPWPEADHAWQAVDWSPETLWFAEAREALESRFDRLAAASPEQRAIALPTAPLTRDLERRLAAKGSRAGTSDKGLAQGLAPWSPPASAPGPFDLAPTPVDEEPARKADLAALRAASAALDRLDRELARFQEVSDQWRSDLVEIAWTSNVGNTMLDADATLARRAALPATPPPVAPPPKPNIPEFAAWVTALKKDRDLVIPGLMASSPARLAKDRDKIRSEIAAARSPVVAMSKRYPKPSEESKVVREVLERLRVYEEKLASVQFPLGPETAFIHQTSLRKIVRDIGERDPNDGKGISLGDRLVSARRRPLSLSSAALPSDRLDRAATRWLHSRRASAGEGGPADKIAASFLERAKQWEEHYKLKGKLTGDVPYDYATSREALVRPLQ